MRELVSRLRRCGGLFLCRVAATCWIIAIVVGPATATEPVLREQIKVYSALVTLGDLFQNAGPASTAPVFRAPDLGTQGVVAATRVATAARQHGLYWANPGGVQQITVERPSRVITLEEVRKLIAERAARDLGAARAAELTVTLDLRQREFHVDPRVDAPLTVKRFHLRPETGQFDARIGFTNPKLRERDHSVRGRVQETLEVPVPIRAIARGDIIRDADIKLMRLPTRQLRAGVVMDLKDIADMAAKRRLQADEPVRRSDIEPPKLVTRNTQVTIVYQVPGLSLRALGRAQADGAYGDTVSVLNTRSNRVLQAVVNGPGTVAVGPPGSPSPASRATARATASVAGPRSVR